MSSVGVLKEWTNWCHCINRIHPLDLGGRPTTPLTLLLAFFVLDGLLVQGQWPSDECAGEEHPCWKELPANLISPGLTRSR